jgi:uncharacterized RDD family membrane protein YckC
MEPLDTSVAVETPEHIVFRHRVAGPARRLLAYILDQILCYTALAVLVGVLLVSAGGLKGLGDFADALIGASVGLVLIAAFAAQWVYFVAWESMRGTTPGKRALGLVVVTVTGQPIGFVEAALRNLLRAADASPPFGYFIGVASMALTKRFQRLGDLVAGTMVVVQERRHAAAPLVLTPAAQLAELETLPEVVTLDADERHALELFLRRRGTLGPAREAELAWILAPMFAARFRCGVSDPVRLLALLYDRAESAGRTEGPPSSRAASFEERA